MVQVLIKERWSCAYTHNGGVSQATVFQKLMQKLFAECWDMTWNQKVQVMSVQ